MISTTKSESQSVGKQLVLLARSLRPKQWTKNLIIFMPALFALRIHEPAAQLAAAACFVAFCLVSGAVYTFNDVLDAKSDAQHPVKCKRPIASGALSPQVALTFALVVAVIGLVVAFAVRPAVFLVISAYIALQIAYALSLKHVVLLDIGCIATGFVLRAVAGALAVHVPASAWFLLCTGLGSLFIALEKRRQELKMVEGSNNTRQVLGEYSMELVSRLESMILSGLLFSYMLYTMLSWHGQWMMLTIPFILYGIARYIKVSMDGTLAAAPEDVLLKDRPIQVTVALWALTSALIVYGIIPKASGYIYDKLEGSQQHRGQ
jgi:4-hydroxybenzoate polyprenyltransferase